jgi:autotransporter-associated beta strand protein
MKTLRRHRRILNCLLISLLATWQAGQPLQAATTAWTGASGTTWSAGGNWSTGVPTGADDAVFGSLIPTSGASITLAAGSLANSLSFDNNYTLSGGNLALSSGRIYVDLGRLVVLDTQLTGNNGLLLTGGGAVRLTQASTYTGQTTLANGILIITDPAQLGADSSPIRVTESNTTPSNTSSTGFPAGSLVLDGLGGGIVFTRDLLLQGNGPISSRNAAVVSSGNNTLAGHVTMAAGALTPVTYRNTRINQLNGTLTLSGGLRVNGTAGTTVSTLGGVNSTGGGSYVLTGPLSGTGTLDKAGAGTLYLTPSDTSEFSGRLRISASSTVGQSSVRVSSANVFGTANSADASAPIDMNGGVLELRADGGLDIGKNVYNRASSTYFVGPSVGGNGVNGTVTFGTLRFTANTTATFNGRNGFGITFGVQNQEGSTNNTNYANNLGGLLTFTGNIWNNSDSSARTLAFSGNGNTLVVGSIVPSGTGLKHLTKSGSGVLTINGTASTLNGDISINGGAIAIRDFRAINSASNAVINVGSSSTSAGFIIGTSELPDVDALRTTRPLNLAGTTGGASIYANQTDLYPVVLGGAITATGGSSSQNKTLTLGGTSKADNIILGSIPNNAAGGLVSVTKVGPGTWVLAGANQYTGTTTITNGTLKIQANGPTSTVLNAMSAITFGNSNGYAGSTLEFVGRDYEDNTQSLGVLGYSAGSNTVRLTPGQGGTASIYFSRINSTGGATLNFVGGDSVNNRITFGQLNDTVGVANGILTRSVYWNGADFAYSDNKMLRAPVYGVDPGMSIADSALISGQHNLLTHNLTSGAVTVTTLKMAGSPTLSLNPGSTLTVSGGGLIVDGGNAVITGGTVALGSQAFVVRVNQSADTLTITSAQTGTGGLTKSGAGTLVLAGPSTRTGTISLDEGTLRLAEGGVLGAANSGMRIRQNAVLDLNGVSTGDTIGTFNNIGVITNSSSTPATLTIGNGTGDGTSYGSIQDGAGVIHVTKVGTGVQSWLGTSTYTGATTIGGSGLVTVQTMADIGQASSIGRGDASDDASNAASLVFNGSASSGLIYQGNLVNGNLTLGSVSTTTNRLFTVAGEGVTIGSTQSTNVNNAIIWTNTGDIVHDGEMARTFTFSGTSQGDNTFMPRITDSGTGTNITSVVKTGTGVWRLGGNNTYSGSTTITQGILMATDGQGLSPHSNLVFNGGALYSQGNFHRDIGTGPGQMQFAAPAADTAQFSGGFMGGDSKLTVTWSGTPVWGVTSGFLDNRNGLILNGSQALSVGATGSIALSEVELASDFSLGSANVPAKTITVSTSSSSANVTVTTGDTSGLVVGQFITGTNIPAGSYIVSINSATTFTISANASASGTGIAASALQNNLRPIRVDDNGNTGADIATISGTISASDQLTGLRKLGTGMLRLSGDNTYSGETNVAQGGLSVFSLGMSGSSGATSVGDQMYANTNASAITLGNGSTGAGVLQYIGAGETSDRKIRLNTTTGSTQIHADGTGPLILTNVVNDMVQGAKALVLRGGNGGGNMITSQLADYGGALSVTVDAGATWILSNANTYTGNTTVSGGALGIGNNQAIGTGTLVVANGNVFAYGEDRTLANNLNLNNNATSAFIGNHNLTIAGTTAVKAAANNITLNNNIAEGKALTFEKVVANDLTANRSWTIDGAGTTVLSGDFTTTTNFGVGIIKQGRGTLILGGTGAANFNKNGANIDVDRGTLRMGANNAIPSAAGAGGLILSPEITDGDVATFDLNGTTQTVNAFTSTSNGTVFIDNTSAQPAVFRFGANNAAVNFGSGIGSYSIVNTGAGALDLVKLGNTTATFNSGVVVGNKGTIASEGGGSFIIGGPVTAASGLRAIGGSTLALIGGIENPSLITSIEVGAGSTLSLLDGAGSLIDSLTSLKLGSTGTGTATLSLNIGDGATDTLTLLTGGTLALGNTVTFNLTDAGLSPNTTYTLLDLKDGGLQDFGLAKLLQGLTPGGFDGFTWTVTDNLVQITTGDLILGDLYWRGQANTTWNGSVTNWSTDKAGTTPATSIPGQGNRVIFSYNGVGAAAVTTTLEQNIRVAGLVFEGGTTTPSSVTINPGANASNRLDIGAQGIAITAGGPAAVTLGTNLKVVADQTWNVESAGTVLTLAGSLLGDANIVKNGNGRVVLTAAADPSYNITGNALFTVNAGSLEFTHAAALGGGGTGNKAANIVVNGGAFYYNNSTAGTAITLPYAITLNGGTLSGGGANHVYGGPVTISGASGINMADANGAGTATTARNITLSGVVSGTGSLTINSISTASSGNQVSGTFTINNAASTWSGDLIFNRGTVTIATAASQTVTPNNITFNSFGRLILQGVDGQTIERAGQLTYAAGAIGEIQIDNTIGTPQNDFTVNQNGQVTLGAGGTGASMRVALADTLAKLNINGDVLLGGNSSISLSNNAARLLTISGIISDGGNGYSLAINDDAGGWSQTNGMVRLTGANTFSGNLTVGDGIVEFTTVSDAGGAASSLGRGTAITLAGGNLRFIGDTSQSTNRAITTTGNATISASGESDAVITFTGAISQADNNILTLAGTGTGVITGGIIQPTGGSTADLSVSSGTWTIRGGNVSIADDLLMSGGTLTLQDMIFTLNDDVIITAGVLNLNTTGVLVAKNPASTSSGLYARNGGTINLNANDVWTVEGGIDFINIGDATVGDASTLNTNSYNITAGGLLVGGVAEGLEGHVTGTGTITVTNTATDWSLGIRTYRGTIAANLAGVASLLKQGLGEVVLSGDNRGLIGTVAATRIDAGNLVLDYSIDNNAKISSGAALDMRGGTLILNGSSLADTVQTVNNLTLANGTASSSRIVLNPGAGRQLVLNLGSLTRSTNSQDGTLRIVLPAGEQTATNGVTTTTALTNGILGSAAFLTVQDATGTWFATKSENNIVPLVSSVKNDITTWVTGDHITDDGAGFTGSFSNIHINSLRFNAAGGSAFQLGDDGRLSIATGGILITDQVTAPTRILGGNLVSGASSSSPEIIVTHDGSATFEIGSNIRVNHILIKAGSGTLLLSGNNNFTGVTELQNGILQVSGGNAIGDYSLVTLSDDRPSMLQLLASETIGRLIGGSSSDGMRHLGMVDIGSHTLTINQTASATYAGQMSGTGKLVKQGPGNLQLTNSGSGFSGEIHVVSGALYFTTFGQTNAGSLTVYKGGALMFDKNGSTGPASAVPASAAITLHSANGGLQGQAIVRGLAVRTDNSATRDQQVGVVTLGSGASYVGMEATATNADSDIIARNIVRQNGATLSVRGTNLGTTNATSNQFRISDADNQTTFISGLVGGNGEAGTKNIKIVPWAIGETTTGALTAAHMGNSLVTFDATTGFRPLDLSTEYNTYAAAGATDNVRHSLAANLTGLTGKTINSLVLNNEAKSLVNFSGTGAGQTLTITSGALLFTTTGATADGFYGTTLGGFNNGIAVGSTGEYVIHVVNPNSGTSWSTGSGNGTAMGSTRVTTTSTSNLQVGMAIYGSGIPVGATVVSITSATEFEISLPAVLAATNQTYQYSNLGGLTATIDSPLTSVADITKSGRGVLVLTGNNTAGGGIRKTTINEGVLEISGLNNIGGATGELVFAGGALRFGSGFADDLSTRTIRFLNGGGTLDTNGQDLVLANSLGSGVGGFVKIGEGILTLNGPASYLGGTTILGGTITIGADDALGLGGDLLIGAGSTLDVGTHSIHVGQVTLAGVSPSLLGTGSIMATGYSFQNTGNLTVSAALAGNASLVKTQTTTLTLTGLSTYTGTTEVKNGTLVFDSIRNVGTGPSALGNPSTLEDGVIRMGLTSATTALTYVGTGHSTNRLIGMQGSSGTVTLNANGTGAIHYGGARFEVTGNKTLNLGGTSNASIINSIGQMSDQGGALTVVKTDANTWALIGDNRHTGATAINNGVLQILAVQNLTGALQFGSANSITTAGTLRVMEDASFGSLLVQTNSQTNTSSLIIEAGKTLTINGTAIFGSTAGSSYTKLHASGAGSLVVNNTTGTGNTFLVGNTGSTNASEIRLGDLANLNVTLNTASGVFMVSSSSSTNSTGKATLELAVNSTITASALTVGGGGAYNGNADQINHLKLGTGSTVVNVNTFNIGTGARDLGSVTFQGADGTLKVRAADGVGAAAFNLGAGSSTTAAALPSGNRNTFDVSGHEVDLLFGAVNIGTQNGRTGPMENWFAFDQGTLVTGNLNMGSKTAAGNSTNEINIGGGTVRIGSGTGTAATLGSNTNTGMVVSTINVSDGDVIIGSGSGQALILGNSNTNASGSSTAILNVTGGQVTLATTGSTAVTLANASAGTSTGYINLYGGTLIVQGDIVSGTGAGMRNAALRLDGGTLDMGGHSVGTSLANAVTFMARSGSLQNLGGINGGAPLEKESDGILRLLNGNTYTSGTLVNAGTLLVNNTTGSATGSGELTVQPGAILGGNGIVAPGIHNNIAIHGTLLIGEEGDSSAQKLTLSTTGLGMTTINGVVAFDLFGGQGSGSLNAQANNNDQLVVNGYAEIGPDASLYVSAANLPMDDSWVVGTEWQLFDWSGLSGGGVMGSFTNQVYLPDLSSMGLAWDVSKLYTHGTIMVVVPEPGRMLLVFFGLLGLFFRRRRA